MLCDFWSYGGACDTFLWAHNYVLQRKTGPRHTHELISTFVYEGEGVKTAPTICLHYWHTDP